MNAENDRLESIRESCSQEGWDSYGAAATSDAAIEAARAFMASLFICPTVNGGIQLSWLNEGWTIEFDESGRIDELFFSIAEMHEKLAARVVL